MTTEIELKLSVSADDAKKLARLPPVKAAARGRARRHKLHSVYYDTPELDLQRTRVALRLRRDGTRWIQTLKGNGRVEAGLHERVELETPVPAQILDYRTIAQSGLSDALADPGRRVLLQPVFITDISRVTRHLQPAPGIDIELCVDAGQIRAGERSVPISEVELELKAGPPAALLDFAAQLLAHIPMRLEPLSKAERGYALVQANPAGPVKAAVPQLDAQMGVTQAFRAIVASCVSHLQANDSRVLVDADEEYLHQARVALRRLRSAFSVFQPGFPRAALEGTLSELRWLTGCLGPARDWDVFTLETLRALSAACPGDAGVGIIVERAARLRRQAGEHAGEALESRRYTALLLQLTGLFLREPWQGVDDEGAAQMRALSLPDFAQQVLQRRHRKTIRRGKQHAQLDAAGLHQLRIEIKKLRYAAEFFSTLYEPKAVRAYTVALAGLQERLGSLNDAATVERLCASLRQPDDSGRASEALGMVRGWAAASAHAHLERLPQVWDEFRETEVFW